MGASIIVVFGKDRPDTPYIIVELKKPKLKAGKDQPRSYCRPVVCELLELFEHREEFNKKDGEPYCDLSWMWERLGLERE